MARLTLQARHSRTCPLYPSTLFKKATKKDGCECSPSYALRGWHNGRLTWEPVGQNRKEAERGLDARRGEVARKTYRVLQDVGFTEWADQWLASATVKENSKRVYRSTLDPAKRAFGKTKVRDLGPEDVARFLDLCRRTHLERQHSKPDAKPIADATLAKHLRQLGACLQAAIPTYASENPVRLLHRSVRPRGEKPIAVYYTNEELARLWPELSFRPVMLAFCKLAASTGMRFGELAALRWGDVDLLNREVHVSRTFVEGLGEQTSTKSGEARTVDLTAPAARVLEAWWTESGALGDGLVFEREEGGHLAPSYVTRSVLYPALERAGIPRVGERGRKRDFHSFRHTFARIALENGAEIVWVSSQLGHSNITLTVNTYGHWARSASKAQADRLADAFAL